MSNRRGGALGLDALQEEEERRFEQDNDEVANSLAERVGLLRDITVNIQSDIRQGNQDLENVGFSFASAKTLFQGTMGRLDRMMNTGSSMQTCKLACFVVGVVLFLYALHSFASSGVSDSGSDMT